MSSVLPFRCLPTPDELTLLCSPKELRCTNTSYTVHMRLYNTNYIRPTDSFIILYLNHKPSYWAPPNSTDFPRPIATFLNNKRLYTTFLITLDAIWLITTLQHCQLRRRPLLFCKRPHSLLAPLIWDATPITLCALRFKALEICLLLGYCPTCHGGTPAVWYETSADYTVERRLLQYHGYISINPLSKTILIQE